MRSHAVILTAALVVTCVTCCGIAAACRSGGGRVSKPDLPPLDAVPAGEHELSRLQYNDTNDVYRAFLVANPKTPLRLRGVRLALLTDEQVRAGKKPHVVDDGGGAVAYLGPRFKLGLLHGVVERRVGVDDDEKDEDEQHNVVVRTERKVWQPFIAPKLDAEGKSVWHTPAVHYPPPLSSGPLIGSGGSGPTREQAWNDYRRHNGSLPQAVRLELEGYVLAKDLPKDDDTPDGIADAGPPLLAPLAQKKVVVDAGPVSQRDIIGIKPVPPGQEIAAREALRKQRLEEERLRKAREASKKSTSP